MKAFQKIDRFSVLDRFACVERTGLLVLVIGLHTVAMAAGKNDVLIATFDSPDSAEGWFSVNDNVMGGISKGGFELTDRNTLLFKGDLSLERNGGFASIRTSPRDMNLAGASGIRIKAKGDGRTYWVGLHTAGQMRASSYRAYLATTDGAFTETFIPISDFKLQAFGRQLPGKELKPETIVAVGFTIADKKAGTFELEIESIKAVFENTRPAEGSGGTIVDVDAVLLPPEESSEPLTPSGLIALAIERGVPLFNSGNAAACAAVYEIACESLRVMPGVSEEHRADLSRSLAKMRAATSDREKAWILRHALDKVMNGLHQ